MNTRFDARVLACSIAEIAAMFGVTEKQVHKWREDGAPVPFPGEPLKASGLADIITWRLTRMERERDAAILTAVNANGWDWAKVEELGFVEYAKQRVAEIDRAVRAIMVTGYGATQAVADMRSGKTR